MGSMHLGLIDGPFVPHNLISAQERPVPLPKFQMAPKLKILMSSGSKKSPDILSFSFKKFRQANPLQLPQRAPYGQRHPLIWHFYISLGISLYLKGPNKRASLHFPQKRAPMETDAHSRALLNISVRVPSKGALHPGSLHRAPK